MYDLAFLASLALTLTSSSATWTPRSATWADFNADGKQDLLLIAPEGGARLFLAGEAGQLARAPQAWGLDGFASATSASVADVDGDQLPDLLISGLDGEQHLLRNTGATFEDVTAGSGLASVGAVLSASWVDYDQDARPDLALTSPDGELVLLRNLGSARFERVELDGSTSELGVVRVGANGVDAAGAIGGNEGVPADRARTASTAPGGGAGGGSIGVGTTSAPGTALGGVSSAPGRGAATPAVACAPGVVDAAGGACITASSDPVEGALYPLGVNLFVDPFGSVGVGTLTPDAELDLQGGTLADLRIGSFSSFANDFNSAIELGNWGFVEGMRIQSRKAGLDVFSRRNSQGGPITVGPHLTVLRQDASAVGIGTATPETTLDVNGEATVRDDLHITNVDDLETITIEPARFVGGGARMTLRNGSGVNGLRLDGDTSGAGGLLMYRANGGASIQMYGDDGGAAAMRFYKPDNSIGVLIDADYGGDARIITEVLEITGGADLVESFDTGESRCEPGMVLVIDETRPGELAPSSQAYDVRVAGVVSGAGGVQPGLRLGQSGRMDGSTEVALTGRVYVRCNAEGGEIRPGDMLTTSSSTGEAMRAADRERSFGSVIGKAMTGQDAETGLVLVLVGLQ